MQTKTWQFFFRDILKVKVKGGYKFSTKKLQLAISSVALIGLCYLDALSEASPDPAAYYMLAAMAGLTAALSLIEKKSEYTEPENKIQNE